MKRHRSGNAVIFILLAIFLFGALAFSFVKSGRNSTGNLTATQAKLSADDILGYATSVDRGVQKLLSRGCSESELNFNDPNTNCGSNPDSPSDNSCAIFDAAGAGVGARSFPSLPNMYFKPTAGSSLQDVGTWDINSAKGHQDIVLWFGPIDLTLCQALNTAVGNPPTPPSVASAGQNWCYNAILIPEDGHFGNSLINLGTLAGKKAGCIEQTDNPSSTDHLWKGYDFFYVLEER